MGLYRKKPVVIEAFKLGVDYIPDWFMDAVTANEVILHGTSSGFDHVADTNADIHTLEGWHHANYGDYIIRGVHGELYPCKADIFHKTYTEEKQRSNADRIRAMSDEELAEFICGIFDDEDDDICGKFINGDFIPCYDQYSIKEWLQQPVED